MEQKNNDRADKSFQQFSEPPVRKHSRFLAVMFGFIPGAGHMYLGKMNRGVTLMAVFFANIALGVVFTPAFFLLPLVWFYAFFDCLNISGLPHKQLEEQPDELGFGSIDLKALKLKLPAGAGGRVLGWSLILVGGYMLYEMVAYRILEMLETFFYYADIWWLRSLISKIPQIVLSVVIILLGVRLLKGSKKRADSVPRYHGGGEDPSASIMELIRQRAAEQPENEFADLPEEDNCTEEEAPSEPVSEPEEQPVQE